MKQLFAAPPLWVFTTSIALKTDKAIYQIAQGIEEIGSALMLLYDAFSSWKVPEFMLSLLWIRVLHGHWHGR